MRAVNIQAGDMSAFNMRVCGIAIGAAIAAGFPLCGEEAFA